MDSIRAVLVGTGFGGSVVLPAVRQVPGVELVAVCSADVEKARAFAAAHAISDVMNDAEALARSEDLQLVLVCTPPLLHAPMCRAALDAGKHTFSTKPLAATAAEARQLANSARANGVVTAMDLDNRYVPVRRFLRYLVADGYLGTPRCVVSTVLVDYATRPTNRIYFWNWVSLRNHSGGLLGASLGLHHLDLLRYTFGEVPTSEVPRPRW
jgi:predicted dehydrogenase